MNTVANQLQNKGVSLAQSARFDVSAGDTRELLEVFADPADKEDLEVFEELHLIAVMADDVIDVLNDVISMDKAKPFGKLIKILNLLKKGLLY